MKESEIYKYAFYKIGETEHYQYLPTSKLDDVIYVEGMKTVKEKSFIKDGNIFIELPIKNIEAAVGEPLYSKDIVKRYYENDPIFQSYDMETIEYFEKNCDGRWTLYPDGEVLLGFRKKYVNINHGEVPKTETPQNIIESQVHWYLELYHNDGTITYEKTLYDDKKYRGQDCEHYTFVKIAEYELNGEKKQSIIERDKNKYPYQQISHTALDDIIDRAKGLISQQLDFEGFAGVTPLYTFNTEDSASVFHDTQNKIQDSVVTTVTGSGDAILDLFLYGADKIISFDTNILTKFYGELKFIAAKYLTFEEFSNFCSNLNENIYRTLEMHLSSGTRKFWNELYAYCNLIEKPIKDSDNTGLFYPTNILFYVNETVYNEKGYFNEENYSKLQEILKNKTLDDISFVNCDIMNLPESVDLSCTSYIYLSNILDFIAGVNHYQIDIEKLIMFKDFIVDSLVPASKENADIDICYLKHSWHQGMDNNAYLEVYPLDEGFEIVLLSNGNDNILSFKSHLLKNENSEPKVS